VAKKKSKSTRAAANSTAAKTVPASQHRVAAKSWSRLALPLILLSALAIAYVASRPNTPKSVEVYVANGLRHQCRRPPEFVATLGLNNPSLSTAERDKLGLSVIEKDPQTGQRTRTWQHPSWRQAGNLSAFATDAEGNIYVIPAPRVNLAENPPERQNRVYKVDRNSAEMKLYFEFPVSAPVSQRNPYAGMGLSYDCATNSLYLSSIAGSSPEQELGKLLRIRLGNSPQLLSTLDGFDGFGIASVDAPGGPALLVGHARSGDAYWVKLDKDGNFLPLSQAKVILSLRDLGPEGWDRVRKFDINTDGTLIARGIAFQYNLAQPSAQERPNSYEFKYDLAKGKYEFVRWVK
jgi:hypothetical protein